MFKIIIPGNVKRDPERRTFQCHVCGCVFCTDEYAVQSDYRNGIIYKTDCPTCGVPVWA